MSCRSGEVEELLEGAAEGAMETQEVLVEEWRHDTDCVVDQGVVTDDSYG